ncbi:putative aquaporin TIP-type RB7-18C [Tasmannia lanceolata]|uniref:putative aquaporin TIP-type RB7-18C n=1 Tax=Tasmannia lanceolata TaxID=3420 RepID=UPI004063216A
MASTTLSRLEKSLTPTALRSYLAEFISTFIFVFAAVGSTMSASKMTPDATSDPSSLVVAAVAHAFALSAAVYMAANISGGHVNPAVTFGLVVGGHVSITTALFYWAVQLLGSTMACLLLRVLTAGQAIPASAIATEMTGFGGVVLESILTFALVYTIYVTMDPKKGPMGIIGPIMIGFVAGANALAAGPFTGGSMNPARSFGSAMISGNFKNHGVYWVGPFIGAGIAGLVYQNLMIPWESTHGVVEALVV